MNDDRRRNIANLVSYAGVGLMVIGLMAIGIVLPMLQPPLLTAWAIAIGLVVAGALCLGLSQRLRR